MAEKKRAIALGFFDGVHIGHAALLTRTKERAEALGYMPSVLSFDVHPDDLVTGGRVQLINSAIGREELIRRLYHIDNVVFIHFTKYIMQMPWQDFANQIISQLDIGWMVVGHDFTFGYKGEGTAKKLQTYCEEQELGCDIIPPVTLDGRIVSSTYIRQLLADGNVEEANRYLGHPHVLTDTVRSGYHLGTKLGAPTINMCFPDGVIVPRFGVYAAKARIEDGSEYIAVTNIGVRPTVGDNNLVSVESHLLDYSGNLYGRQASVEFYKFIRPERKYADMTELATQIKHDGETAKNYFLEK